MSYEVKGVLYKKFDVEQKTSTFQAREFVIKTEGQYPQFIKFQLVQDRVDIIEKFEVDNEINVHFDLRGREWNEKFFTNLNAWKVDGVSKEVPEASNQNGDFPVFEMTNESGPNQNTTDGESGGATVMDDLPF